MLTTQAHWADDAQLPVSAVCLGAYSRTDPTTLRPGWGEPELASGRPVFVPFVIVLHPTRSQDKPAPSFPCRQPND